MTNKTQWHLFPWHEAEQVLRDGFMRGNEKLGRKPDDWKVKRTREECLDAAFRHITAYARGARVDDEGAGHIQQAIARLLMVAFFDNQGDA